MLILVLMNGPPFDVHAERIEKVFVDGVLEYERKETRQTALPTPVGPFRPIGGGFKSRRSNLRTYERPYFYCERRPHPQWGR